MRKSLGIGLLLLFTACASYKQHIMFKTDARKLPTGYRVFKTIGRKKL